MQKESEKISLRIFLYFYMHFDTFIEGKSEVLFCSSTYERDVERGWGGPTGMSSVDDVFFILLCFLKVALLTLGKIDFFSLGCF